MKLNLKTLLIDDNIIDQIVTKQLLKKKLNLHAIEVVSNGKEGLEWLSNYEKENDDFLVILLDIKMPEMDGFEFLAEFEKQQHIKSNHDFMIVMLSSSLDPRDLKRAQNNIYVKTLLSKPLPTAEFAALFPEYNFEN